MTADPVSRHSQRLMRFSERGLIFLVLAIGVGLGWLVRERESSAMLWR